MKLRKYKILICMVFMMVFISKMTISVAPAFLSFNSKTINAVIMQLELESKNEKEDPNKDSSKEKKFFDETFTHAYVHEHVIHIIETAILLNQEHSLYTQVYHPTVPTPPPDTKIA